MVARGKDSMKTFWEWLEAHDAMFRATSGGLRGASRPGANPYEKKSPRYQPKPERSRKAQDERQKAELIQAWAAKIDRDFDRARTPDDCNAALDDIDGFRQDLENPPFNDPKKAERMVDKFLNQCDRPPCFPNSCPIEPAA